MLDILMKIIDGIENKEYVLGVFLDLSKAYSLSRKNSTFMVLEVFRIGCLDPT